MPSRLVNLLKIFPGQGLKDTTGKPFSFKKGI
jgi:hypothetical protein